MSTAGAKHVGHGLSPTESPLTLDRAKYDRGTHALHLRFPNGVCFEIPLQFIEELKHAQPDELEELYLTPTGETIALDALDAYISVSGLIRDCLRQLPRTLLAKGLGSAGGSASSEAKRVSAAANGKKGGRPRKSST